MRLALAGAAARLGARRFGPFDMAVEAGERIAILGPSGAGKSTLVKLVAGERAASEGDICWDGQPLAGLAPALLAERRAVLPQSHGVTFGLPVELVVSLGRIARAVDPQQPAIVRAALQAARAAHLRGRRFDTLSGGEQARVQLARVFAQLWDVHGGLLLVDEPLAALDPGLTMDLMDALQAFVGERRHALVAVLHDVNQALASFDRLWLVQEGRLLADVRAGAGAIDALERLYGIELHCVHSAPGGLAVLPVRRTEAHARAIG
jgi:iron complex transport system ATP-binding protein